MTCCKRQSSVKPPQKSPSPVSSGILPRNLDLKKKTIIKNFTI